MRFSFFSRRQTQADAAAAEQAEILASIYKTRAAIEFLLDGTIVTANDNFLRVMGYRLEEIQGRRHRIFVDPDYATSTAYADFWRRLNAGETFTAKFPRIAKGGKPIWIQATYAALRDAEGKPYKIIKFADDITNIELAAQAAAAEKEAAAAALTTVVEALRAALAGLTAGNLQLRLTTPFPPGYEPLRVDFNAMLERLSATMAQIASSTGAIKAVAADVAQFATDLSRRTQEQTGTLQQTSAALASIAGIVTGQAAQAAAASTALGTARSDAGESGAVLQQTVAAMAAIEHSSTEINSIIGVIDEIAFQTNLLALNAGVEAARAGEAGRGFAVVAMEVRALAQRSADAAKQIKTLISASGAQVGEGARLVAATSAALQRITAQFSALDAMVAAIASAANKQQTATASVTGAMQKLGTATAQTVRIVEGGAAASQSLVDETDALDNLVAQFQAGASRLPPPRPRAPGGPGRFMKLPRE
jgi:methyl-accepting chemotaxis protein